MGKYQILTHCSHAAASPSVITRSLTLRSHLLHMCSYTSCTLGTSRDTFYKALELVLMEKIKLDVLNLQLRKQGTVLHFMLRLCIVTIYSNSIVVLWFVSYSSACIDVYLHCEKGFVIVAHCTTRNCLCFDVSYLLSDKFLCSWKMGNKIIAQVSNYLGCEAAIQWRRTLLSLWLKPFFPSISSPKFQNCAHTEFCLILSLKNAECKNAKSKFSTNEPFRHAKKL